MSKELWDRMGLQGYRPIHEEEFQRMCETIRATKKEAKKYWRAAMFSTICWALTYLWLAKEVI